MRPPVNRSYFLKSVAAAALTISFAMPSLAAEKGTKAEAEALAAKAVAHIKSAGPEKAFADFTNGPAWKDRDLYVFVYDMNGKCVAHGANPKLVGKDLLELKDPDGKPVVKMFIDVAKEKGKGWTDTIKFRNPTNDKVQQRINYVVRTGDYVVGTGVYPD